MKRLLLALALTTVTSAAYAESSNQAKTAIAALMNLNGDNIGTAKLVQAPKGVIIQIAAMGLTPGLHGFHLHSNGACDTGTGFKSAKGHVGKNSRSPRDAQSSRARSG